MASSPEHLSDELEELELSVTSSDSDDATIQYEAQQSVGLSRLNLLALTVGFGTDAYNIFVMNIVLLVLTEQFDQVSEFLIELVTTTVLIGAIIGQVIHRFRVLLKILLKTRSIRPSVVFFTVF